MERKVADIESEARSRGDHAISKEEFIAQKMITAQKLKNVQEDFSPLIEKMSSLADKVDDLEENDKKLVVKFSGVLDNVITSVDAKMNLLTGLSNIIVDINSRASYHLYNLNKAKRYHSKPSSSDNISES